MTQRQALHSRLSDEFVAVDADRLAHFGRFYRGKVRDLFIGDDELLMVTTDRLSAFDVVLTSIPCKGAILNAIAEASFAATEDVCPNHFIDRPHPNVMRVKRAQPIAAEIIVRRYITGSLWRDYQSGDAGVYEIDLPTGLRRDQRFEEPIITPSTKAEVGLHDEPISRRGLVEQGLVDPSLLDDACAKALALFARGEKLAAAQGLILVDTKYEFGTVDGELIVIDEIHTADSSRYWMAESYAERFAAGEPQHMLDKENIRQWLIGEGYRGEGTPPVIPEALRLDLAEIYAELHERLLGKPFDAAQIARPAMLYGALGA
jgi:phosphoribosylaminoimidazole-succinocarboxamide synthase